MNAITAWNNYIAARVRAAKTFEERLQLILLFEEEETNGRSAVTETDH